MMRLVVTRAALLMASFLGPIDSVDRAVQSVVQDARQPALERPARMLSDIGKPVVVTSALLAICIFDPIDGVLVARLALGSLIPVNLAVETLKRVTFRARPDGEHERNNASFPSSHAANAFALATVFAWRWRRAAWIPWLGAAAVAASRVYLNRHFMSDVMTGALIGVLGASWVLRRWARRPSSDAVAEGSK